MMLGILIHWLLLIIALSQRTDDCLDVDRQQPTNIIELVEQSIDGCKVVGDDDGCIDQQRQSVKVTRIVVSSIYSKTETVALSNANATVASSSVHWRTICAQSIDSLIAEWYQT